MKYYSVSEIGKLYQIRAHEINKAFEAIGLIRKIDNGWEITQHGRNLGGRQKYGPGGRSSIVVWNQLFIKTPTVEILLSRLPKSSTKKRSKSQTQKQTSGSNKNFTSSLRTKSKGEFRGIDGHYLRSKAEVIVDNWLFHAGILHVYERRLPIRETLFCDFYLPHRRIFIEYWGITEGVAYKQRFMKKRELYQKYNLNLLELFPIDIEQIDDALPIKLLQFGFQLPHYSGG